MSWLTRIMGGNPYHPLDNQEEPTQPASETPLSQAQPACVSGATSSINPITSPMKEPSTTQSLASQTLTPTTTPISPVATIDEINKEILDLINSLEGTMYYSKQLTLSRKTSKTHMYINTMGKEVVKSIEEIKKSITEGRQTRSHSKGEINKFVAGVNHSLGQYCNPHDPASMEQARDEENFTNIAANIASLAEERNKFLK